MRQTLGIVTIRMFNPITNFNTVPSVPNNQSVYLKNRPICLVLWKDHTTVHETNCNTTTYTTEDFFFGGGGDYLNSTKNIFTESLFVPWLWDSQIKFKITEFYVTNHIKLYHKSCTYYSWNKLSFSGSEEVIYLIPNQQECTDMDYGTSACKAI